MITVIIPVLNESPTVADVVAFAKRSPHVSEVIVVDDGSIDGTPEVAAAAGARVITSTFLGKGAGMEDGVWAANTEIVVFLDGDLCGLREGLIEQISAPLLDGTADFVKAKFSRDSGRVTVLTAKPLLTTFFPELRHFEQPLGGIIGVRKSILRNIRFESDFGVDIGLLIDVSAIGATIVQVDVGHLRHDSQSLEALGDMAKQVVRVILDRAGRFGRLDLQQVREVEEVELRAQAEMSVVLGRPKRDERLALFDLDGTLIRGRFVELLARRTNRIAQLGELLDSPTLSANERTMKIAALFNGVPKSAFEETARSIPLQPNAVETVLALRKAGYRVGIVSHSFRIATEVIRRRVFADFSVAHLMKFRLGVATGEVMIAPAMHPEGDIATGSPCPTHGFCKRNVLLRLCELLGMRPEHVIAVGDDEPDICMMKAAGISVAFQPKSAAVANAGNWVVNENMLDLVPKVLDLDPSTVPARACDLKN